MVQLTSQIVTDAAPEQVWGVLTEFDRYAEWHPYQTISGKAELFGSIQIQTRSLETDEIMESARGVIITFDRCRKLQFFTGRPLLFSTRRFFELTPRLDGTSITQGIRVDGIFGRRAFSKPESLSGLEMYLDAFEAGLTRRLVSGGSATGRSANRHARRAAKATRK